MVEQDVTARGGDFRMVGQAILEQKLETGFKTGMMVFANMAMYNWVSLGEIKR